MKNTSIQFNFPKQFLFCQNFIFLHTRLCSALLFKVHSKDEIKAVIHYAE